MTLDLAAVKERLVAEVDRRADALIRTSHELHAHPELGYAEHYAHDLLVTVLEKAGLRVERHAGGVDTAFRAAAGTAGPTIAVLCEYDALPGIGHACGHNIIGSAGVGAGLAAAALADELGGRIVILGTPAEEGGGGKVALADAGAFDGVDAAMMVHPAGADLTHMEAIAVQQIKVTYLGRAAHAAAAPHQGLNALDAAVLGYMNVAALRQHLSPGERVHGIFTEAGTAANVVPERAAAHWFIRSPRFASLEPLKERVFTCLRAGAEAAGCTMEHQWIDPAYAEMIDNPVMVECYVANAGALGRSVRDPDASTSVVGSTDMGNVSYLVPAIHPMIQVAPADVAIHTQDFVRWAASPDGDRAVIDGAKAMAMTVADLWLRPEVLTAAREAFMQATSDEPGAVRGPPGPRP